MSLEDFIKWQAENVKDHHVHITIEPDNGQQSIRIWVYDSHLHIGNFVKSAGEIDLVKARRQENKRVMEEIRKMELEQLEEG
jgi:hypothetical protein